LKNAEDTHAQNKRLVKTLENKLSLLDTEQSSLISNIAKLEKQKSKYYNIFNNSSVAIWEEDFSEVYEILKDLPCTTKEEYTKYLDNDQNLLQELINKINIIEINDATTSLFAAKNKEEVLGSMDRIFIDESFNTLRDQFVCIATGSSHYESETIGRRFDGSEFHILLSVYFPDKKGKTVFIIMMEITDRIEKEQNQTDILNKTIQKKEISDVLIDITFVLASKTDQEEILDTILEQVDLIVPYSSANIMLIQGSRLIVVKHKGYDKYGSAEYMTKFAQNVATDGGAKTFDNVNQTQIIYNTMSDENWVITPETSYIKSFLSMPIEWQGNIIGLLNLDSDTINTFKQQDIETLKPISQAAAISIQKAGLFELADKEIEERKKTENILSTALKEKELLLQEVHHRVKNNLTIIIALMNLQNSKFSNPEELELFEELSQRIHSISLVHEKLYEHNDLSSINFYSYVYDLYNSIYSIVVFQNEVKINIEIPDNTYFSIDILIPLGLIINEIITNSFKYAFSLTGGIISINLELIEAFYILEVKDNGAGFPTQVLNGENTNLGILLINSLVDQIKGTVLLENNNGAMVTIKFPLLENPIGK
jgi:two-component sensor histidine kinase/putative methionine-R-sulfoxide reductase with GAF domain